MSQENLEFVYKLNDAKNAFAKFMLTVDESIREAVEDRAMDNAFAVEVSAEYENDLERWEAALSTAALVVDDPAAFGI